MGESIVFMILLQVVLIGLNAVFACAEIAIISVNDNKLALLASSGDKRAIRLQKLTSRSARFLATIQVAITLSGFLGSAFAAENFSEVIVDLALKMGIGVSPKVLDSVSVIVITVVLSYFTLVFGELVPKQVAMRKAEPIALAISGLISTISVLFSPVVSFLTFSTNTILRIMGIDPDVQDDEVSEEEIRMMVDVGSEKGTIASEEREFIQNVFEFDDLSIEDILTHRKDVVMLDIEDDVELWDKAITESRFTYYPICDGSADKITGVLNTKDYFRLKDKSKDNVLKNAVSSAYFVPETLKADRLFKNMKKEREAFAVVLDEYGGMSGILTLKDLIEQLVGDLNDDDIAEMGTIERIGTNSWRISGNTMLDEIEKTLDIKFSDTECDTLGGLVFDALENIPEDGFDVEIEIDGLIIRVETIINHRITSAVVTKKQTKEA